MVKKITDILGSVRFWTVTLAAASAFFGYIEANGFSYMALFNAVSAWLIAVASIGTLDSVAQNLRGTKKS